MDLDALENRRLQSDEQAETEEEVEEEEKLRMTQSSIMIWSNRKEGHTSDVTAKLSRYLSLLGGPNSEN